MPRLSPVDFDPFAAAPSNAVRLEPVDTDPFAGTTSQPKGGQTLAPASGVFPAITAPIAQTPPQSSTPLVSPAPVQQPPPPAEDPGVLTEAMGDTVKGWHAAKRGAFLTGYMLNAYDDVDNIASHLANTQVLEAQYPSSAQTRTANEELERLKDDGAGGILPALGVYATHPRAALSATMQSLPSMLAPAVTVPVGALAGGAVAGPPGAVAGGILGIGVGSAAADFGSAFEDYARDKWKPKDANEWKAVLLDPEKYREAGNYAALHSGMVGLFDAAGGKLGGKVGMAVAGRLAERGVGKVGRVAGAAVPAVATDATVGAAGEAAGQLAGSGRINDPGAVAGEFSAGLVTGGAGAAVEPVIRASNIGGGKTTPATEGDAATAVERMQGVGGPPDIITVPSELDAQHKRIQEQINTTQDPAAHQALIIERGKIEDEMQRQGLIPAPAPEMISGSVQTTETTDSWYSPARKYVEEKGPGAASPEQWAATLRNAQGVKQEELVDNGFNEWLGRQGDKVTKGEVLDFLDEKAMRLEVTERDNTTTTHDPDNYFHANPIFTDAKYHTITLPGERTGYTELAVHMPTRNVEGDPVQRDYVGGHYTEPNVIVHARVTEREDVNGTPLALIEEIQSDAHQQGRKHGYQTPVTLTNAKLVDQTNFKYEFTGSDGRTHYGWAAKRPAGWGNTDEVTTGFDPVTATEEARVAEAMEDAQRFYKGNRGQIGVTDLPFKKSWPELAFKQMLKWAAERGHRRIAWVDSAEQRIRNKKEGNAYAQLYDKELPRIARKWARELGGTYGETQVVVGQEDRNPVGVVFDAVRDGTTYQPDMAVQGRTVKYIDIPQAGVDLIQKGLPLYSEMASSESGGKRRRKKAGATLDELADVRMQTYAAKFGPALDALAKQFGLTIRLRLWPNGIPNDPRNPNSRPNPRILGMAQNSGGIIHLNVFGHKTPQEAWATIMHEFGHHLMYTRYARAGVEVQTAVKAAYQEWLGKTPHTENFRQAVMRRDNPVIAYHNTRNLRTAPVTIGMLSKDKREYWMGFEEWFAEQVATWATTDRKPLALVEKFFKGLADTLLRVFREAVAKFNLPFQPQAAMTSWLNSFLTDVTPFAENIDIQAKVETQTENQRHTGPGETAVEMQPETIAPREMVNDIFNGRPPKEVQEVLAYADKFNKIYKWGLGIHQVAQRNKHIVPLQEYTETIAVAQLTKQQVMIRAQEVLKQWNKLGGKQSDALAGLIDDVQNMVYRTPLEVTNKVARFPTISEMQALISKHGVSKEGVAVFKEIANTFQEHLTRYEAVLRNEANKITDLAERQKKQDAITRQIAGLKSKPYFPAMRFGDYTITVKNAAGNVIHFETFEYKRTRDAAAADIQSQYGVSKDEMELGKLDRQAKPLLGVPTQLLDLMAAKLTMSQAQRDALEQLKFELSPAQSFKHRFQHKRRIAGYSQDFRRAYAAYFFHGANHLMKAMYADRLRALTKATKEETKGVYDVTTRHEITAFMDDHRENWLDPKSDWAAIRSIAFLWALAFSPAAAAQNLTQTLMTSYPFLAQGFGDIKAVGALMKVGADFRTFYKKGTLEHATDVELKAIARGIQDGIINEAMAPELAGYAEGDTLGKGFGGNELQRGLTKFMEVGSKLFELAEQVNRRLVFRAAFKLAMENPAARYVREMPVKHRLHYDQLRAEGWPEAEAAAYVTARDAVITTQFQYGREYAPRFMRGKARSIFVFKTFIQNYVVFLANYPQARIRSLLVLGFLGGLMGIPGAEDLKEILQALGYRLFGKDFNIEKEARKLLLEMVGQDERGRDIADLVLNGLARWGYGIPAFMDMVGGTVGVDVPVPTFDRSKSISAGTLLPVELGKLFGPPVQDQDQVIAAQAQKASGAVFGAGFNVYKALTNSKLDWNDAKRWEKAVPRALGSLMHAYRVGTEGGERTNTGAMLVKYDVRDTEQLMEVLGIAGGYMPFRTALQWDRVIAAKDAVKLWDVRREGLMKQMGNAILGKDAGEIERVKKAITAFNESLPPEARGKAISGDTLRQSVGTQARSRAAREAESSVRKSDIPIMQEVQKLYPDARITGARKVPDNRQ